MGIEYNPRSLGQGDLFTVAGRVTTEMEVKWPMPSVIARLMGLDELPPEQPALKKPKVLSENYLRRVASIGAREKCPERHSFSLGVEEHNEQKDVFRVLERLKRGKFGNLAFENRKAHLRSSEVITNFRCQSVREARCVLSAKKVENSLECDCSVQVMDSEINYPQGYVQEMDYSYLQGVPSYLKPGQITQSNSFCASERRESGSKYWNLSGQRYLQSPKKVEDAVGSLHHGESVNGFSKNSGLQLESNDASCLHIDVLSSPCRKQYFERKESKIMSKDVGSATRRSRFAKEVGRKVRCRISRMSTESPQSSHLGSETNICSSLSGRRNQVQSSGGSGNKDCDEEMDWRSHSSAISNSTRENNLTLHVKVTTKRHKKEVMDGKLSEQDPAVTKSSVSKVFPASMGTSMAAGAKTEVEKDCHVNLEELHCETNDFALSVKDEESCFNIMDNSIQQDASNGFFEEQSISSQCSGSDPESVMTLEETYQPSPNSVLELLYRNEISTSSYCLEHANSSLNGLRMQLELLKSETLEVSSEGSGSMIFSDGDVRERSVVDSEENEGLQRYFRVVGSREFSYLVDVLTEANFTCGNLLEGLDSWDSQECPIHYSIFETLEKKYGEQESWKRSDRKLLFDRINSGLTEILLSPMGMPMWTKPVARRCIFEYDQQAIQEELWMLLVGQENEARMESKKLLGKDDRWLDLGHDIQVIGIEIENSLIDELVADVVCNF